MPRFSDLHSDYPLILTLFGSVRAGALKHAFGAAGSPIARIPILSMIVDISSSIPDSQAHGLSLNPSHVLDDNANCNCLQPRRCTHPATQQSSPDRGPSAGASPFVLGPARTSPIQVELSSPAKLEHCVDDRPADPQVNIGFYLAELMACLLLGGPATCVVASTDTVSALRHHLPLLPASADHSGLVSAASQFPTLCSWLLTDGKWLSVVSFSEREGVALVFEVAAQEDSHLLSGSQSGGVAMEGDCHSVSSPVEPQLADSDGNKSPVVHQQAAQSFQPVVQPRSIDKEHIMSQSRGAVSFEPLFAAEDIGLRKEASVEHAIKVFLYVGEAIASRWIEMPKGVLLLQTIPGRPESGAIYLYDRQQQIFYFVFFEDGRDDSLTTAQFEQLVDEYNLLVWTSNPAVMRGIVNPALAC
jgi:hypothetical protein